jgi:hypothetical protein
MKKEFCNVDMKAEVLEDILHWLGFYEFLPHPGEYC